MDGIKIQTSSSKPYYLTYKTWNSGQSSYYPDVNSTVDDYAGSAGKPIQLLSIHAYKNDGTQLTSGVVVMYRAYVDGEWLPWVSNAAPEYMQSVQSKFNLGGTLDTSASYAGKTGSNISGIEIRVFEEDGFSSSTTETSFSGVEATPLLSYMVDSSSSWTSFNNSVMASPIDGIKIQTSSSKSYYLTYKTWNTGQSSYYPEVSSIDDDYAGSAGKPIKTLSIHAYSNNGTKLTSGVVVMYRAYVDGEWLPWVSNADPAYMQSVQSQYNLGGTLDTSGSYAGKTSSNISGIEIRVFEGDISSAIDNLSGSEAAPTLSYMADSYSNWNSFSNSVTTLHIDGLKIQTDPSKPYYLTYKTWNSGQSSYYPEVSSTEDDYAGSVGKPIQLLSIHAYKNDGTKLTSGVVVMYRAYVDGEWLPWVSNADPEWMASVQAKYSLGGTLDTNGYYAGISGRNISGIEIRIFEENSTDTQVTPTGDYKIIQAPFITQEGDPTGCESVSTVMALNYLGINTSVDTFIDNYLNITGIPFDPNVSFGGDPRSSGYGCYAPVIKNALDQALNGTGYYAKVLSNVSLQDLCSRYIDNNVPVILWATVNMATPTNGSSWTYNSQTITWIKPEHCLLLVGYDDNNYIFNDPKKDQALTYYSKSQVETAYAGLYSQAVVILQGSDPTVLSYPDTLITDTATRDKITFSQDNYNTYQQAYNYGTITLEQKNLYQQQVLNYADVARADYIIVNPQSTYAYVALGGDSSSGCPLGRSLYNSISGLDVIVVQRLLELIDYYELPFGELYGTYDENLADSVSSWKDPNWTPTTPTLGHYTGPTTNSIRSFDSTTPTDTNSISINDFSKLVDDTEPEREWSFLDMIQEYSKEHRAVQIQMQYMLDATGIEVGLPSTGPNSGTGRADILKKQNDGSQIWEVKHKSSYSIGIGGSGDAQLRRYLSLNDLVRDGVVQVKYSGDDGFNMQKFSIPLTRGTTNFESFYMPYDEENYLLIEFDSTVQGLITYDKVAISKQDPEIDVLASGDTLTSLNSSGLAPAVLTSGVILVGAIVLIACPPAGVAAGGTIIAETTLGGSGILTLVPLAEQAAEIVLAAAA